jgi:hypothetical protein
VLSQAGALLAALHEQHLKVEHVIDDRQSPLRQNHFQQDQRAMTRTSRSGGALGLSGTGQSR